MEMVRPKTDSQEQMLTVEETAKELGVCKKWVLQRCNKRLHYPLPYRRVGRRYWFVLKEVRQWNTQRKGQ